MQAFSALSWFRFRDVKYCEARTPRKNSPDDSASSRNKAATPPDLEKVRFVQVQVVYTYHAQEVLYHTTVV